MLDTTLSKLLLHIEEMKTAVGSTRLTAVVSVEGKPSCKSRLGTTIESAVESATIGPTPFSGSVVSSEKSAGSPSKSIMPVVLEKNLYSHVVETDRFVFVLVIVAFWKSVWYEGMWGGA